MKLKKLSKLVVAAVLAVSTMAIGTVVTNAEEVEYQEDSIDEVAAGTRFAQYEGYSFYKYSDGSVKCFDKKGKAVINEFKCDGTYTYYFQLDGTAMKDRLTYHPDGVHVIYFDSEGHEVFSDFANVKKSIEGKPVDDLCFFNVYGYMYVDVVTYDKSGTHLYYANPYGVMERSGWFQFSEEWGSGMGYANADGTLMCNAYTYDQNGNYVYIEGNGNVRGTSKMVARYSGVNYGDDDPSLPVVINNLTIPEGHYKVVCRCESYDWDNFIIWTYDSEGYYDELLVNSIPDEGEYFVQVEDDVYLNCYGGHMEITANGAWTIAIYKY